MALLSADRRWHFREKVTIGENLVAGLACPGIPFANYLACGRRGAEVQSFPNGRAKALTFCGQMSDLAADGSLKEPPSRNAQIEAVCNSDLVSLGYAGFRTIGWQLRSEWKADLHRELQTTGRGTIRCHWRSIPARRSSSDWSEGLGRSSGNERTKLQVSPYAKLSYSRAFHHVRAYLLADA